ncbi:MAG: hypothetical protein AAF620_01185 [Bacteroidota bacterium]
MKKSLLLCGLLFCLSASLCGQGIRHVKGIKSVDVLYGFNKYGNSVNIGFVNYFSEKIYGKVNLFNAELTQEVVVSETRTLDLDFQRLGVDILGAYTGINFNEVVFINGIGGLTLTYNQFKDSEVDFDSKIKPGIAGGVEIEVFPIDRIAIISNFIQKYTLGEEYSDTRYYINFGLRINF